MKLPGRRSILSQYVTLAGANLLSSLFGFFITALLARYFGPSGFGAISLAQTLLSYAVAISSGGMLLYAIRAVAMRQSSLEQMIPTVIFIRFTLSTVVYIGLAVCAYTIPQLYPLRTLILLFGLTLFSKSVLLRWVPQAIHKAHVVAISDVTLQFLNLCMLYLLLMINSSLNMAPIALLIAEIIVVIGLMLNISRRVKGLTALPGIGAILKIFRESVPIGLTQLIRIVAIGSDLIILGFMSTYSNTGIYAAAYKIFLFILSLGSAYFVILLPRMSAISASNILIIKELKLSFQWALPIMAGMIIGIWFTADFTINLLFGTSYADAAGVLRILSLATFANIVCRHYRQVLLVKKLQQTDLKLSVFATVLHVFLKLLLIPFLGLIGCALGTLAGEIFLMIAQRRTVMKTISGSGVAGIN